MSQLHALVCAYLQMLQNSFLARDVALERLSELTKNFSGAEIEGLVKDAVAYALNRQVTVRLVCEGCCRLRLVKHAVAFAL